MAGNIRKYTFDEYIEVVRKFHSYPAPGVLIGGFMVELAYRNLPEGGLFDAISETDKCLPDSVQLLTPCTVGNGWLRVMKTGRFALIVYDKTTGDGIRVYIDISKLDKWPEIKGWFLQTKPKKEQDSVLLLKQIGEAGTGILSFQKIKIEISSLKSKHGKTSICPQCKESYPSSDGEICLGCQGHIPYKKTAG